MFRVRAKSVDLITNLLVKNHPHDDVHSNDVMMMVTTVNAFCCMLRMILHPRCKLKLAVLAYLFADVRNVSLCKFVLPFFCF